MGGGGGSSEGMSMAEELVGLDQAEIGLLVSSGSGRQRAAQETAAQIGHLEGVGARSGSPGHALKTAGIFRLRVRGAIAKHPDIAIVVVLHLGRVEASIGDNRAHR